MRMRKRWKRLAPKAHRSADDQPTHAWAYVYPRDIVDGEPDDEFKLGIAWMSAPHDCRMDYTRRHGMLGWRTRRQVHYAISAKSKKEAIACEARCAAALLAAGAWRTGQNEGRTETWKGIGYRRAKELVRRTVAEFNRDQKAKVVLIPVSDTPAG